MKLLSSDDFALSELGWGTAFLALCIGSKLIPLMIAGRWIGLSALTAREMVMSLKTWPLLDGYRGRPKSDVEALVKAIVAFSEMVATVGDRLLEAEINPLFVLEAGQGVKAADGIAVLTF